MNKKARNKLKQESIRFRDNMHALKHNLKNKKDIYICASILNELHEIKLHMGSLFILDVIRRRKNQESLKLFGKFFLDSDNLEKLNNFDLKVMKEWIKQENQIYNNKLNHNKTLLLKIEEQLKGDEE